MRGKKIHRLLSSLLVVVMLLSVLPMTALADDDEGVSAAAITTSNKPADGTTTGNPFTQGTGGSNSFRIPAMVTLNDGTIVAAADARWNTTYDGGGLDTIVSYSTDNGANWNYTFTNYLGDNGNTYNGSDSTAFIDPALATDGSTVYMLCDLYPYGVALNGSNNEAPSNAVGFNSDGTLKLAASGSSSYDYYLKDGQIYDSSNNVVSGYTVDTYFNITGTDGTSSNLFFSDSPYQVVRTGYLYLTKSTDGGKSWSEPTLIPNVKTSSEQVCLVGPGRGLVTGNTIVFPVYSYNGSSSSQQMGFIYSSDGGATWTRSDNFTGDSWSSESAVVELSDGTLRFFYRNGTSALCYADYSWTTGWGSAVNTGIATNSNTQISAISYSKTVGGQQVILVSCPTGSNSNGSADSSASARLKGKIFVGYVKSDNTMSWQSDKAISVTSNNSQFMHSCLTELNDGKVAILYENKESAWGTGDYCYYTISYAKYDLDLGFDTDKDKNICFDENTGVEVNFGENDVQKMTVQETSVSALDGKTYVAYDIIPVGYTGSATVTIPLTSDLQAATSLTGFVVENDNSITKISGARNGDSYTFEMPHFSVGGVADTEAFADNTPELFKDVSLPAGGTSSVTLDGALYGTDGGTGTLSNGVSYSVKHNPSSVVTTNEWQLVTDGVSGITATDKYLIVSANSGTAYALTSSGGTTSVAINNGVISLSDVSADSNMVFTFESSGNSWKIKGTTGYLYPDATRSWGSWSYSLNSEKTSGKNVTISGDSSVTMSRSVSSWSRTTDTYLNLDSTAGASESSDSLYLFKLVDSTTTSPASTTVYFTASSSASGTSTLTLGNATINVTVAEGQELSIKENETTSISVELHDGQTVEWSSADSSYVGVAGKVEASTGAYTNAAILSGLNKTDSAVTVTGTVYNEDGAVAGVYKWLVTVTEGDKTGEQRTVTLKFDIAKLQNCTLYYCINGGELVEIKKENLTTATDSNGNTYYYLDAVIDNTYTNYGHGVNISFFAAPDEGYALTYMAYSSNNAEQYQYFTISDSNPDGTGSEAWPFDQATQSTIPSSYAADEWKNQADYYGIIDGVSKDSRNCFGYGWALYEGNMTIDQWKVMMSTAIALGCDGAQLFTKNTNGTIFEADLTFVAQKLPTVEKTITSITHNGTETAYTDGMKVEIGDTINYNVVVTRYATNASYGTITYDNEKLEDTLTNNNGISNPDMGTSTTSNKTYVYTTSLTLTMDNFADVVKDGKITNTVDFSYSYSSQYSSGSLTSEASAVADITVSVPEYAIDFGLPVEINLNTELGGTSISKGLATYGTITPNGTSFTYTPNMVLPGVDHVTLMLTNGQSYGVNIYPASNVLYEDSFLTVNQNMGTGHEKWTQTTGTALPTQATDKKSLYGYDDAYKNESSRNSFNSYWSIDGLTSEKFSEYLTTTFYGNGFDLIGTAGPNTGMVYLLLQGPQNKLIVIDTSYVDGKETTLYQVPLAHQVLTEGNYTVNIRAAYRTASTVNSSEENNTAATTFSARSTMSDSSATVNDVYDMIDELFMDGFEIEDVEFVYFDESSSLTELVNATSAVSTFSIDTNAAATADTNESTLSRREGTTVTIDGFRVYRNSMDEKMETAYKEASENVFQYYNILEAVLSNNNSESSFADMAYVEGDGTGYEQKDYQSSGGPQNELYLKPGAAVVISVSSGSVAQISARAVNTNVSMAFLVNGEATNDVDLSTNTEMYYLASADNGLIVVTNTGNDLLALGNLKVLNGGTKEVSEQDIQTASLMLMSFFSVNNEEPESNPVFTPDRLDVKAKRVGFLRNKLVTVTITASTDVAKLTVNGREVKPVNSLSVRYGVSRSYVYVISETLKKTETKDYVIVAYDTNGVASEPVTVQG